ncbi:hypothetical protein J3R83DRAFT_13584 [Lanmaoa asiatica]|nr:hypothetical protein J3R83DRAFT_13584 [Lanmaoa asiatica]
MKFENRKIAPVELPRQKMVVVASPQSNELEQKKRRQTLERAKANHLSKQLQMRLQYAKLKVEHGWQRQNLNEVENLYFHHSHLRSMRQGAAQRPHYATVAYPPAPAPALSPAETHVVQSGVPDPILGPSPSANDASSYGSVSPPSQSPSEHAPSATPSSQPQPYPPIQTPVLVAPPSTLTNRPPSAFDLSDPNILALPVPVPAPAAGAFPPHVQLSQLSMSHPQPGFAIPAYASQPHLGTPTSGSIPLYPIPTPYHATAPSQPPVPASTPTPTPASATASASASTAPIPTTPIPTPAPIAPTALTYDSFWSTHASSTGPTRALYRTHTGFTASATPGGNVAMLTPGGHAAVMTAEGVYVGGASSRGG